MKKYTLEVRKYMIIEYFLNLGEKLNNDLNEKVERNYYNPYSYSEYYHLQFSSISIALNSLSRGLTESTDVTSHTQPGIFISRNFAYKE